MTHDPNRQTLMAAAACAALAAGLPAPAVSQGQARPLTPRSVSVDLPGDAGPFAGPNSDLLNGRCLACHSASMVLTQPGMTAAQWRAVVVKMRDVYRAPVPETDVEAIVAALASLQKGADRQN